MTHDHRNDPDHGDHPDHQDHPADPAHDDTRVVERERYVEREAAPPAQPASQVNIGSGGVAPVATSPSPGPLYHVRRVLSLIAGILAVLLGLRILLLLFTANQGNAIVDFVYATTEPFVAPFRGIFDFDVVVVGDSTFDVAALVALFGWALIYLLLMAILSLGDRSRTA